MPRLALKFVLINCFVWALLLGVASCGGGGGTKWSPTCSTSFLIPNYATITDPSPGGTANKLRWWRGFPIKVWLDLPVTFDPGGANISSDTVITEAINRWVTATSNGVRYTFVGNSSEAHVKIHVDVLASQPGTLGDTISTVNQVTGEVVAADITLFAWQGMSLEQFRDGLKATAAHEMGHALYLRGHSATDTDLMYWSNNSSQDKAISTIDLNTIRTAYCDDYQTRGRAREVGELGEGPFVIEKTSCPVVQD